MMKKKHKSNHMFFDLEREKYLIRWEKVIFHHIVVF